MTTRTLRSAPGEFIPSSIPVSTRRKTAKPSTSLETAGVTSHLYSDAVAARSPSPREEIIPTSDMGTARAPLEVTETRDTEIIRPATDVNNKKTHLTRVRLMTPQIIMIAVLVMMLALPIMRTSVVDPNDIRRKRNGVIK
jgi:hypothetical protein